MKWKATLSFLWLGVSAPGQAGEVSSWLQAMGVEWRGQYQVRATQGLEEGELSVLEHSLRPEMDMALPGDIHLHAEGRLRYEDRDQLEPGSINDSAYRSSWSRRHAFSDHADAEIMELYVDGYVGDTFYRIGKQSIAWGSAIGLEVLDVVNPVTMREFILPDRGDRRIPLWAVNIERPLGDWMASLVWLPDTTYEHLPAQGASFAMSPSAFLMQPGTRWAAAEKPDDAIADSDIGGQLSSFLGGWDVSLNYLYHFNDRPVLERKTINGEPTGQPVYYRTHTMGGSLSNAFGDVTIRAEIGYDTQQFFSNAAPHSVSGWSKSPELSSVFGIDYSGIRDWLISSQLFVSYLPDYEQGIVREQRQDRATLLLRGDLFGHTQTAEMLFIHSLDNQDGVFQLSWDYRLRSHITLSATLDVPYGDANGVFGQFRDRDQLSFSLQYSF